MTDTDTNTTDEREPIAEPSLDDAPDFEAIPVPVFDEDPADPPRARVVGNEFRYSSEDGLITAKLRMPHSLVEEIAEKTPREQLYGVLRASGADGTVQQLEDADEIDSRDFINRFWQAYAEKQQARLGESLRSVVS